MFGRLEGLFRKTQVDTLPLEAEGRLHESNKKIYNIAQELLKNRAEIDSIVWYPHGLIPAIEVYHAKGALKRGLKLGHSYDTHFVKWLSSEVRDAMPICSQTLMNCVDFVYFMLFRADLIDKDEIRARYKSSYQSTSSHYYGFPLKDFRDFDPKTGEGQVGDILIGYNNGTPDHVMILSQRDMKERVWTGIGLWSLADIPVKGFYEYNPAQSRLYQLQMMMPNYGKLTFKRCPLARALERVLPPSPIGAAPSGLMSAHFRITYNAGYGHSLGIRTSDNWEITHLLSWTPGDRWQTKIFVSPHAEYKVIFCHKDGTILWQEGRNREVAERAIQSGLSFS